MGADMIPFIRNFSIDTEFFAPNDDSIIDECVTTPGQHRLLRFDMISRNIGDADFLAGKPLEHPDRFVWSQAHRHWHLKHFNEYKLLDSAGNEVVPGFKQGFCLEDFEQYDPQAGPQKFTCPMGQDRQIAGQHDQGVSPGWQDVYESQLPCQFVIIDGVPDGDYQMMANTNAPRLIPEDDFTNNIVVVGLHIEGDTVTLR